MSNPLIITLRDGQTLMCGPVAAVEVTAVMKEPQQLPPQISDVRILSLGSD